MEIFHFKDSKKSSCVVVSELWSFFLSFTKLLLDFFPFPLYFNLEADVSSFLVPFSLISICEYCVKKQELVIESSSSLWFVVVVFMFFRHNFIPLELGFIIMNFCSCIIQSSNLALKVMNFTEYLFLVLSLA